MLPAPADQARLSHSAAGSSNEPPVGKLRPIRYASRTARLCRHPNFTWESFMRRMILLPAFLVAAALSAAAAQTSERALALAADDAGLQWGPCPPFIPEGCQIAVLQGDPDGPRG